MDMEQWMFEWRREQHEANKTMLRKLDELADVQASHNTRLTVVENTRLTMRWLIASLTSSIISAIIAALIAWKK